VEAAYYQHKWIDENGFSGRGMGCQRKRGATGSGSESHLGGLGVTFVGELLARADVLLFRMQNPNTQGKHQNPAVPFWLCLFRLVNQGKSSGSNGSQIEFISQQRSIAGKGFPEFCVDE
jgi:hypothetical protein